MEEEINKCKKEIIQAVVDIASRKANIKEVLIKIDMKLDEISDIYESNSYEFNVKMNWIWTMVSALAFIIGIAIGHYN